MGVGVCCFSVFSSALPLSILTSREDDLARVEAQEDYRAILLPVDEAREEVALVRAVDAKVVVHAGEVHEHALLHGDLGVGYDVLDVALAYGESDAVHPAVHDLAYGEGGQEALVPGLDARHDQLAAGEEQGGAFWVVDPYGDCSEPPAVVVAARQDLGELLQVDGFLGAVYVAHGDHVVDVHCRLLGCAGLCAGLVVPGGVSQGECCHVPAVVFGQGRGAQGAVPRDGWDRRA